MSIERLKLKLDKYNNRLKNSTSLEEVEENMKLIKKYNLILQYKYGDDLYQSGGFNNNDIDNYNEIKKIIKNNEKSNSNLFFNDIINIRKNMNNNTKYSRIIDHFISNYN